jgi:ABC-type branched-subunit amino acid transport system ATPase component
MPLLELIDVRCAWSRQWWTDPTELLEGANISLEEGQWCALVGDNGIGKSTLLHGIAGSCPFVRGTIRVHGTPLDAGVVPQRFAVGMQFVPQEVLCNAAWRWPDVVRMAFSYRPGLRVPQAVEHLRTSAVEKGLLSRSDHLLTPRLARFFVALLSCPSVLLLDEVAPIFPSLSPETVYQFIKTVAPRTAVVFVDHSLEVTVATAETALVFKAREEKDGKCTLFFKTMEARSIDVDEILATELDDRQYVDQTWESMLPLLRAERSAVDHLQLATHASILSRDAMLRITNHLIEWWPYLRTPTKVELFSGGMKVILHSVMELFTFGKADMGHPRCRHLHLENRQRLHELNNLASI